MSVSHNQQTWVEAPDRDDLRRGEQVLAAVQHLPNGKHAAWIFRSQHIETHGEFSDAAEARRVIEEHL